MSKEFRQRAKAASEEVIKYYPNAKAIKIKNYVEIISDLEGNVLGKGQNSRCAWISASRNIQ